MPPANPPSQPCHRTFFRAQLGIRLTDADLHALLDRFDPTGDGGIHYDDFTSLVDTDMWQSEYSEYGRLSAEHTCGPCALLPLVRLLPGG